MKQIALIVGILLLATSAFAQPIDLGLDKLPLPDVKQGFIVSFKDGGNINSATTATILEYDSPIGGFDLDAGYVIENEPIIAIAYDLPDLEKVIGVSVPIAKYITPTIGAFVGVQLNEWDRSGEDDNHFTDALDYGLYVTIAKVQF